jgi:hypothetical protein
MRSPTIVATAVLCVTFVANATRADANGLTSSDVPFVDAHLGVAYANMLAFSNNGLFPGVNESRVWGSHFGATVGLRFGPVAFGLHGDLSRFSPYDIGTVGGVVELRLPIPSVQPWARLGFGYAWLGDVNVSSSLARCSPTSSSTQCPSVRGWNLNGGAGVDFWIGRFVTVGAGLDLYVLNLTRSASPTTVNFEQDGDAVGLQASIAAQLGLHF